MASNNLSTSKSQSTDDPNVAALEAGARAAASTTPQCASCHNAFGAHLHRLHPIPTCAVCLYAARIGEVLKRLDGVGPVLGLEVLPLALATTAIRHGEDHEWRTTMLNALAILAAQRWRLHGSDSQRLHALASEQGKGVELVKLELMRSGIVLALADIAEQQRYRVHRQWRKGAPADAVYRDALRWFVARGIRHARGELRDLEYCTDAPDGSELAQVPASEAVELSPEAVRVAALLQIASSRQRELLEALFAQAQGGGSVSVAAAALAIGMNPKTAHEHLRRLREKAA